VRCRLEARSEQYFPHRGRRDGDAEALELADDAAVSPVRVTGKIGPDLDKLKTYAAAAHMPLEAFIRESVVKPGAYVEKGYPNGVMPTSFASLPKSTLDALVAFLAASAKS
jgi:hypothetical protein